ncbi:hypothetical protein SAMN05660657_03531, partial [Geodermatophilus amargosae]
MSNRALAILIAGALFMSLVGCTSQDSEQTEATSAQSSDDGGNGDNGNGDNGNG